MDLHYHSCESGVGRPPREKRKHGRPETRALKGIEMRHRFHVAIALSLFAASGLGREAPLRDHREVVAIADGDTLTVLDESRTQHKIRLAGDRRAREGAGFRDKGPRESRRKGVPADRPRRGDRCRPLSPRGGPHLSRLIDSSTWKWSSDGFAWRYVQYDKPGEFTAAETDAREHRRGLWTDSNPVAAMGMAKSQTAEIASEVTALIPPAIRILAPSTRFSTSPRSRVSSTCVSLPSGRIP